MVNLIWLEVLKVVVPSILTAIVTVVIIFRYDEKRQLEIKKLKLEIAKIEREERKAKEEERKKRRQNPSE